MPLEALYSIDVINSATNGSGGVANLYFFQQIDISCRGACIC